MRDYVCKFASMPVSSLKTRVRLRTCCHPCGCGDGDRPRRRGSRGRRGSADVAGLHRASATGAAPGQRGPQPASGTRRRCRRSGLRGLGRPRSGLLGGARRILRLRLRRCGSCTAVAARAKSAGRRRRVLISRRTTRSLGRRWHQSCRRLCSPSCRCHSRWGCGGLPVDPAACREAAAAADGARGGEQLCGRHTVRRRHCRDILPCARAKTGLQVSKACCCQA